MTLSRTRFLLKLSNLSNLLPLHATKGETLYVIVDPRLYVIVQSYTMSINFAISILSKFRFKNNIKLGPAAMKETRLCSFMCDCLC